MKSTILFITLAFLAGCSNAVDNSTNTNTIVTSEVTPQELSAQQSLPTNISQDVE